MEAPSDTDGGPAPRARSTDLPGHVGDMARDAIATRASETPEVAAAAAAAAERPPLWAQAMQRQMDHLLWQIHDMQLDMTDMNKTISNMADTSRMSKSEITADFVTNDRGAGLTGDAGGDCQYAAEVAFKFFGRRKIMNARPETGVLHSPSGATVTMGVGSGAFAGGLSHARGVVRSGALAYRLAEGGGCLWIRDPAADAAEDPQQPGVGCMHYLVSVDTLDGERVVVDWGIKQFAEIPTDMRLFI